MGAYLKEDDIYVTSLLDLLNLRFGRYGTNVDLDGIDEMRQLQKEFRIFKPGRSLAQSLRVLGVGGSWNPQVKQKWFDYLTSLDKVESETPGVNGGPAIVDRLIGNLAEGSPLPVFFEPLDLRKQGNRVVIKVGRPLFFIPSDHLVVRLPMAFYERPVVAKAPKGDGSPKKAKRR